MMAKIKPLLEKYDALNERERIAIMLLSVVAIFIVCFELILSPINSKNTIIDNQLRGLQNQISQVEKQTQTLKTKKNLDPDFYENQKIKLLDEQLTSLNVHLKEKMHGLIEPKQMAQVLEVVLTQNTDLKLQRVESLQAQSLSSIFEKKTESAEKEDLGIYRHGLQIEFKGSYLSTLKYLKALDDLPWNFYWDVLELNVDKYPVSTIVITVHTLSFNERWIGV